MRILQSLTSDPVRTSVHLKLSWRFMEIQTQKEGTEKLENLQAMIFKQLIPFKKIITQLYSIVLRTSYLSQAYSWTKKASGLFYLLPPSVNMQISQGKLNFQGCILTFLRELFCKFNMTSPNGRYGKEIIWEILSKRKCSFNKGYQRWVLSFFFFLIQ